MKKLRPQIKTCFKDYTYACISFFKSQTAKRTSLPLLITVQTQTDKTKKLPLKMILKKNLNELQDFQTQRLCQIH